MIESTASMRRERGEARRASEAFRDLVVLLVLLLLVLSVRFQFNEVDPSVKPLPGGVQAAEHEPAAPLAAEPAAVPALDTPDTEIEFEGQPIARLRELSRTVETQTRVLVLRGDTVHEIRLPVRYSVVEPESECSKHKVDDLARS